MKTRSSRKVLNAAAWTYVAATLTSLWKVLYLLFQFGILGAAEAAASIRARRPKATALTACAHTQTVWYGRKRRPGKLAQRPAEHGNPCDAADGFTGSSGKRSGRRAPARSIRRGRSRSRRCAVHSGRRGGSWSGRRGGRGPCRRRRGAKGDCSRGRHRRALRARPRGSCRR